MRKKLGLWLMRVGGQIAGMPHMQCDELELPESGGKKLRVAIISDLPPETKMTAVKATPHVARVLRDAEDEGGADQGSWRPMSGSRR